MSLVDYRTAIIENFQYDDGGREAAGHRGTARDCVVRAIAIAAQLPYDEVYFAMTVACANERKHPRRKRPSSPFMGVYIPTWKRFLKERGWVWHPTTKIGQGCTVHLKADELPRGRLIVQTSRHLVAVIDGVIHDTHDPSRGGTRCVYGYFTKGNEPMSTTKTRKSSTTSKTEQPVRRQRSKLSNDTEKHPEPLPFDPPKVVEASADAVAFATRPMKPLPTDATETPKKATSMKLSYFYSRCLDGLGQHIRERTKKLAEQEREKRGATYYGPVTMVTVEHNGFLDLMIQALQSPEGGPSWEQ